MDHFVASYTNGLLRLNWVQGTFVTYEIAVQAARTLEKLAGGKTAPILVDVEGVTGVAAEARAGMNAYRGFSTIAIKGDYPMGTVLSAFARQSLTPTAYFTSENAALRWLAQQTGHEQRNEATDYSDAEG
ncbi:hypothetical protein ACU18_02035 [Arthrobacter sp. ZBG10]|uniref:DUF7793 family protein n=1 Tax=Micrococcaceae TaxID=1268 RepID=UPI0006807EA0|nr:MULTISPECIES: hypothetical protein [Micrococcaceae]KNH21701.1 hypothetical protein ACU18_02035 [Arthrobacter sp. ZBG10]